MRPRRGNAGHCWDCSPAAPGPGISPAPSPSVRVWVTPSCPARVMPRTAPGWHQVRGSEGTLQVPLTPHPFTLRCPECPQCPPKVTRLCPKNSSSTRPEPGWVRWLGWRGGSSVPKDPSAPCRCPHISTAGRNRDGETGEPNPCRQLPSPRRPGATLMSPGAGGPPREPPRGQPGGLAPARGQAAGVSQLAELPGWSNQTGLWVRAAPGGASLLGSKRGGGGKSSRE